ncbi:hydantoinase B/oxoprolinase family protein [Pseudoxanthobacter sp.]|uniref:hydantoinase B/oxoprolinase family protein n=1 Tax=Pseudoxanthobacter sp. TaxID=1925742 RepID=UPI002FE2FE06
MAETASSAAGKGVRLALINNRLEGVARKMANTLLRTGRSGVLNIARDFSCCIVTRNNELLATAESLPIHVLSGPDMMVAAMRKFHPVLKKGDAFLHNSPYHGCSHAADHTILVPVIDDNGVHHFTVVAKAHQADCGNSQPTTYFGAARDVYEEGALIFPAVKVQDNYETNQDIVRMCRARIRVPDQWWGDFLAMLGAARIGERELLAIGAELGWDAVHQFEDEFFDYTEQRMVAAIRKLTAGKATHISIHDPFPGTPPDGIPVKVDVAVDPDAAMVEIDLRDNLDNLPCGLNTTESTARTAAMVGLFNSIDPTVPKNAGAFRRIRVHLREGCVVGIPIHPTSCSVATTNLADRIANSVQSAMAEIVAGAGLAEAGAVIPPAMGVVSGVDPRSGQRFVNQIFLGMSAGPGAPTTDAWQTLCHVGNSGLCYQDSIELDELRQPLVVEERRFLPDTEGAGEYLGASSIFVAFGPVGCDFDLAYVADGNVYPARGVRGGLDGAPVRQMKRLADGSVVDLPGCAQEHIRAGEMVLSYSNGGGGYGRPLDRDPARVAADVANGWITAARARSVYGVVLAEDGRPDAAATAALRASAA